MIIDIHLHSGLLINDPKEFIDEKNLIEKMKIWGINKACLLPLSETPEGNYRFNNTEDIINIAKKYPNNFIPFCLIDPRFGDNSPFMDFSYLLEEYKEKGCKGIGELLPKIEFDDPRCLNLYKYAGKFRMPVLFDMNWSKDGYGLIDIHGLPKLENALKKFPETVFIGHGVNFWTEISEEKDGSIYPKGEIKKEGAVVKLMRKYKNLYADISAYSGYNALSRDINFGINFLIEFQDKILFGTDSCLKSDIKRENPTLSFLKKLYKEKAISEKVWKKIVCENAISLLKLNLEPVFL